MEMNGNQSLQSKNSKEKYEKHNSLDQFTKALESFYSC